MEPNTQNSTQGTYQPVGVAAPVPQRPGMMQGIIGIVCGAASLLIAPIILGPTGIVLGSLAARKGEKTLGLTAMVISSVFMVLGVIFAMYLSVHPELLETAATGTVINALLN